MTQILPDTEHSKAALHHMVFDNHDINEETPSGKGTTHCTTGTVTQQMSGGSVVDDENRQAISKSRGKTVEVTSKEIQPFLL